ncbi:MAG: ATP-binding protein, partial [Chromatocurvus sp.]
MALKQRILELEGQLEALSLSYAKLSDDSSRYQSLIEHMPNEAHVWELVRDEQGAIRTWRLKTANRAALNAWGMTLEDIAGKTTDEIFHDTNATETFMPIVRRIFAENKPLLWERYFEGTGQILHILIVHANDYFFSTGVDVTEMRRMEASLQHAEKMDAIGQLAGGIAHDFNNQLAGILGYAELLESAVLEPELLEAVRSIITAAQRSSDLTSQLLAFARRGPADFAPVNIETLVRDTISLLERTLDKRILINYPVDTEPAHVLGDSSLLGNALLNIAINARDAMPEGGNLSFTGRRIHLDADSGAAAGVELKSGEYFRLDIRDTGCGIAAETLPRIFDPFYTTKSTGHGMGLASVHGTVAQHSGDITVQSEVGTGSCFTLYLPIASETRQARTVARDKSPEHSEPLCIVVVDDEPALCKLYT